ncbi:MAG: hypothetical protein C0433_14575 [Cyclobacterium sp.]|nr:hypothetical protein [Cyclobacterium sp.]
MKNKLFVLFSLALGCSSPQEKNQNFEMTEIRSLRELVNEGLSTDRFYYIKDLPEIKEKGEGLVLILPGSSCFNCFEDLNLFLKGYFSENPEIKLLVVRNNKIKEREIRFSLQKVISLDEVYIYEIGQLSILTQHEFFPKLGYFNNGKICCLEVFEQGNQEKLTNFFNYLKFMD